MLGLDISFGCDRHTSNFASSQIGFIGFMIPPYFCLLSQVLPKWQCAVDQCQKNVDIYKTMVDKYEEQKNQGNPDL